MLCYTSACQLHLRYSEQVWFPPRLVDLLLDIQNKSGFLLDLLIYYLIFRTSLVSSLVDLFLDIQNKSGFLLRLVDLLLDIQNKSGFLLDLLIYCLIFRTSLVAF